MVRGTNNDGVVTAKEKNEDKAKKDTKDSREQNILKEMLLRG